MPSLRQAINNKCKQCIYDPYQKGAWRQQVEECTSPDCSLFEVRPVSSVGKERGEVPKQFQKK